MKRFSERIGITKSPIVQLDGMDSALKNSLWNCILMCIEDENFIRFGGLQRLRDKVAFSFFKLPLDEARNYNEKPFIKKLFYSLAWNEVYDFIEFLIRSEEVFKSIEKHLNHVLERDSSGYRLVNGMFVPVTNEQEIKVIEEATEKAKQHGLEGAREHLERALSLLAQKPRPDFRNSIKESISAVESLVKQLSGKDSGSLEPALKELSRKIPIHGALQKGFINLYGYTSDEDGIRHAILEDPNVGYDEAKFMLVSCSAFVNFLFSKAQKEGLLKEG